MLLLALLSTGVGVGSLTEDGGDRAALLLSASRLPRTLALILTGASLAIAGLLMQLLVRNRFVEPSTAGTMDFAALGLLLVTLAAPGLALIGKMAVAAVCALAGTALFLLLIRRIPLRSLVLVPLVGIMLGGVVGAVTTFIAYRLDLMQMLATWMTGDFSGILAGRYELLWLALGATVLAWLAADRFTVAGLGEEYATSLGLSYGRVLAFGLTVVAVVSAVVVVTSGVIPFLGLVVPNLVSLVLGDSARRGIPVVALVGAAFVLACDVLGRVVRFPYEIPLGSVVGVLGAVIFLVLLLRRSPDVR
ncbi:iron chelate uptake ABC transporter family permease subunit [Naasia sp. SYSU D00057]|uniref:ABC transporter permease n=1 Tax=Naasia sp. SYSU D00057 TaxID=2817380 RepID=UPI0027DDE40B|nr:iron chelate uptake ABC transporter family permease subunit [Naasia sp. SYSU D00057]